MEDYIDHCVKIAAPYWHRVVPYVEQHYDSLPRLIKVPLDALLEIMHAHPAHAAIEVFFITIIFYFVFLQPRKRAESARSQRLSKGEEQMLLNDWASEPFQPCPAGVTNAMEHTPYVVHAYDGPYAHVALNANSRPQKMLNFVSYDFLSFSTDKRIVAPAKDAVRAYGVGSCGPRGFYGTMKPHLDLENRLAEFLGVHSAIIYSYHFATMATLIPCFSAKQDTILCDDSVNIVIQKGCTLSRSHLKYFKHNDMNSLEEKMKTVIEADRKHRRKLFRRFVVTEGVFKNSGELCRLQEILDLCEKYKFRLIVDDSYGFGALGRTGRGIAEHFGIEQSRIDIYSASLSTSLGAVGAFCAGTNMVVDHQRLGATGYVFSASLPPYVTIACSTALGLLQQEPERVRRLQANSKTARRFFARHDALPSGIQLRSCVNDSSPVLHFANPKSVALSQLDPEEDKRFALAAAILRERYNILVSQCFYNKEEVLKFPASLRVALRSELTEKQLVEACAAISNALHQAFAA